MMVGPKAKRGTVAVREFRGMLRLRWSYRGERYNLSTGTPEGQVNRTIAEMTARIIEGDMVTGNFDPTLAKYQHQPQTATTISVTALFERFTAYKVKGLDVPSLAKYKALNKPVNAFFAGQAAGSVDDERADKFRLHLATWMAPATQRERLITMNACWEWGIKQKLLTDNPWKEVLKRVKVADKQKPKVFTKDEVTVILAGFRSSQHYSHYADFVEFLVSTGCRVGEAIGLQWQNLSDDCGVVWIGEAIARGGKRKSTKTNRSREFRLPATVQALLKARASGQPADALVFPAPKGGHIDDHNFCRRAWRSTLTTVTVSYRHPYICRHTFISHALAAGLKPMAIAEMTGHDPKVLFSRYAANIGGGLQAPDLFG
jgi:integrase